MWEDPYTKNRHAYIINCVTKNSYMLNIDRKAAASSEVGGNID